MDGLVLRCGNLLQNPGFESGLAAWETDNITTVDINPAEGTQVAKMGPGVASLFQDVPLNRFSRDPLFLSFIAYTECAGTLPGNLAAEVLWLDAAGTAIGTGLRALLTDDVLSIDRITYYDVTARPPAAALKARLLLSKGGCAGTSLLLDQLLLAPVDTPNLVQNPGFEQGLAGWTAAAFVAGFSQVWEGNAVARLAGAAGTLSQDVDLGPARPRASFLLSFAVKALKGSTLAVLLTWLNAAGNPIGAPGLDNFIPASTLAAQGNYLSFLFTTEPAPAGAVRARVQFTVTAAPTSTLRLDQVLLVRGAGANLVQNPGFANDLDDWTFVNVQPAVGTAYVGDHYALIGQCGGVLSQTVSLPALSAGRCFLFNFALLYTGTRFANGNLEAQVHWLDARGDELGLGISVVVPLLVFEQNLWLVYTNVTGKAPMGAVSARVQFTKSAGGPGGTIGVDHVLLAMMD